MSENKYSKGKKTQKKRQAKSDIEITNKLNNIVKRAYKELDPPLELHLAKGFVGKAFPHFNVMQDGKLLGKIQFTEVLNGFSKKKLCNKINELLPK
jgi:hypothetical protein